MGDGFEILDERAVYEGQRITLSRLTEKGPDGEVGQREVIRHPGAAVILPVLDDGHVVCVEQYRPAVDRKLLELPAGVVDPGEDPLTTAQRELKEETGYEAVSWTKLVGFFPTPGLSDQRMHVFLATGLVEGTPCPEPDEHLVVRRVPFEELRARLLAQEIEDGKTLAALLYVMFVGMEASAEEEGGVGMIPTVAIVGRPNVGKSTLMNRLARRRISIVDDKPGVTRDRVSVEVEIDGRALELVDTGGIGIVDRQDLHPDIHLQIDAALHSAQIILFLVDARSGVQPLDEEVADRLRRQSVPVILVANKCESDAAEHGIGEFYGLGVGEPMALSAQHGQGIEVLIEGIMEHLTTAEKPREDPVLKIAVVGRRNAGKSTFTNALIEAERVIVSELPGTTRDAIDVRFQKDGHEFVIIDTAGILRKAKLKDNIEYYAQVRSLEAIRRADVVIFLVDAEHGISQIDKRIAHEIMEHCRPTLIGINKWDLVKSQVSTEEFSDYLTKVLPGLHFAPCIFMTAKTRKNVLDTISLAQSLSKQAARRVGTGVMNRAVDVIKQSPVHKGKGGTPKIYFATQVSESPPTIVLFVNKPELFVQAYRRTLENRFRELLDFPEIPLRLVFRQRPSTSLE